MARTPKIVEDRREQIIDAALHVFAQKGFSRATNKDLAREAGITPGLIYHYFENKEAVLRAVVEGRSPLKLVRSLPPQVFALPPEQFFRFLVLQVLALAEGEQFIQVIRMLLPEMLHNQDLQPIGANTLSQVLGFLEKYFVTKMASGELRQADPLLSAQVFIGSVIGFVLRRQILRESVALSYTHEQIMESIVETVLKGLLPR